MGRHYARIAFTPAVQAEQALIGSAGRFDGMRQAGRDDARLGPEEADFIAAQRGFVLASVSATGWPYVQHRGGPPGFVQATPAGDAVAFADLPGNRQHVTLGNLAGDDRVALLFLDHAARRRLKLFGHARLEREGDPADDSAPRRILVQVAGWEWNCPQHIPRLLPAEEVAEALEGAAARIQALEAEVRRLRDGCNQVGDTPF